MSIAVKSGLPSLGSTEGAVISADEVSVSEDGSAAASVGEDLPRGKSAYEIAKENGFNGTETEWLASLKGATGAPGADGKDGENGKTPYVGDNGNWYIGADDTGKPSRGAKGEPGQDGVTPTFSIESVETGEPGTDAEVTMTGDAPNHGLRFVIPRGAKGDKGDPGATPNLTIGTVTTLEAGESATASITGESPDLTLNLGIPKGADGEGKAADISLGLTSAAVGQTIKVKAIDESGKPTAWDAADMPSGGGQPGADGKSAYQYAQEGGFTGTEAEFATKLAQEQLTGTTNELTPTQVYDAVSAGIPVKVQYLDGNFGIFSYTNFNAAENMKAIAANTIVYYNGVYMLGELIGNTDINEWFFLSTTLAQKTDIPSALPNPNALTFTGAVTGSYNGSNPVSVNIPSAVTDDHINSLIDTKLGVIENGSY